MKADAGYFFVRESTQKLKTTRSHDFRSKNKTAKTKTLNLINNKDYDDADE